MGVAQDVSNRLSQLATARIDHERSWRLCADMAAPDAGDFSFLGNAAMHTSATNVRSASASRRSSKLYDTTAVTCVERLASGLEALIMPQSEFWHELEIQDFRIFDTSVEDTLWLQRLRNLMFKVRYDSDSGWINAVQTGLRRMVAFGNGFIWVDDNIGSRKALVRYKHIPLAQCYVDVDHFGMVDTFFRNYTLTARQAVQKFGNRCSAQLKMAAEHPTDQDKFFRFIHAIMPRENYTLRGEGLTKAKWQSLHIEADHNHVCGESGYFEFPIIDFRWLPEEGPYGEGPLQKCLADVLSLNTMSKHELVAFEQSVRPALLTAHAGIVQRPNANPGKVIAGGLSPQGEQLVKPLHTGTRLDLGQLVIEAKRNQVKESLYINLFQILVQNPQMSATEAMIRANEKGELLGPAGARVQQSLSNLVERELGILQRKGLHDPGSAYEVPRSLQGLDFGPQFTGPISRLRHAKEVEGTLQVFQVMAPIAQVDPSVLDRIDADQTLVGLSKRLGMPAEFIRGDEAVRLLREQREQAQAYAQSAAIAKDAAAAGKDSAQALQLLGQVQ